VENTVTDLSSRSLYVKVARSCWMTAIEAISGKTRLS